MEKKYIDPTQEQGRKFFTSDVKGEVVMLNLLRFRSMADYSKSPHLAPKIAITGKEAYKQYMKLTTPFLEEAGGELLFQGKSNSFLIGPENEYWDLVLLVKHKSKEIFLSFAQNEGYLKILGHRTAALEDSRLLPISH